MNSSDAVLTNKENIQRLQDFKEEAIRVHTRFEDDIASNTKDIDEMKKDFSKLSVSIKRIERIATIVLLLLSGEMLDSNKDVILGILKEIAHNVVGTVFANF